MQTPTLPTERIVHQFPHATVIYTCEHSAATGRVMPKLYVQAIDQYRYQREFEVSFQHEPGNSSELYWQASIYQHPGSRESERLTTNVAKRFIARFLELCDKYPTLLFNDADERRARHEGFVHIAEWLHRGNALSVKMLEKC